MRYVLPTASNVCSYTTLVKMNCQISTCLTTGSGFISTKLLLFSIQTLHARLREYPQMTNSNTSCLSCLVLLVLLTLFFFEFHVNRVNDCLYCTSCVIFAARCYASAAYVVMRCLSVTFVSCVKTNKHIINFFHLRVATPF